MAADPEPSHRVPVQNAQSTITQRETHRPEILFPIDALETEGRVEGVFLPQVVCLLRTGSDLAVQTAISMPEGWYGC